MRRNPTWSAGLRVRRFFWLLLLFLCVALAVLLYVLPRYPVAMWIVDDYAQSPVSYSLAASQGQWPGG